MNRIEPYMDWTNIPGRFYSHLVHLDRCYQIYDIQIQPTGLSDLENIPRLVNWDMDREEDVVECNLFGKNNKFPRKLTGRDLFYGLNSTFRYQI